MKINETKTAADYKQAGGTLSSSVNQRILERLVEREVVCGVNQTVSHLLENPDFEQSDDLLSIAVSDDWTLAAYEHANDQERDELKDYLEGARGRAVYDDEAKKDLVETVSSDEEEAREYCEYYGLKPVTHEAFEFCNVTNWFAEKLTEKGQMVVDILDFQIWGRCTTGQAISLDFVIAQIAAEMEILEGQANDWSKF